MFDEKRFQFMGRQLENTEEEVARALRNCGGVQARAAQQLGVTRITMGNYLERWPRLREVIAEAKVTLAENRHRARKLVATAKRKARAEERERRKLLSSDVAQGLEWARRLYGDLTARQRAFVEEYLATGNGAEAARRAGYSAKRASNAASALLGDPKIRSVVQRAQLQQTLRRRARADDIVDELSAVAFSNLSDFVEWDEDGVTVRDSRDIDYRLKAAVSTVEEQHDADGRVTGLKLRLHDKLSAMRALAQHLGVIGPNAVAVQVNIHNEERRAGIEEKLLAIQAMTVEEAEQQLQSAEPANPADAEDDAA